MSVAYAHTTSPAVSGSKPHHFSKYEWSERAYKALGQCGHCVVYALFKTLGWANAETFVSVVWRTQTNLGSDADVSRPTFAKWRAKLGEKGYLLEIPSGRGPQRYYVATFPEWTVFDALEYAAFSLREFCKRPDQEPCNIAHVRTHILPAVLKELKRQVALESFDDPDELAEELRSVEGGAHIDQVSFGDHGMAYEEPPAGLVEHWAETPLEPVTEAVQTPPSPEPQNEGVLQCIVKPFYNALLIYRESMVPCSERGDSSTQSRARTHEATPPPNIQTSGSSETPDDPKPVELDVYAGLKRVFIAMFARFERRLDPSCAMRLATLYAERGALPQDLELTLEEKLLRLFGDGFSTGQVLRFLAEDAPEWTPPPGQHYRDEAVWGDEVDETASDDSVSAWTPSPTEEALALAESGATPLGRRRAEDVWRKGRAVLSGQFSEHVNTRWFGRFVPLEVVDGELVGMAPDPFEAEWISVNYTDAMSGACGLRVVILTPEQVLERYADGE